MKLLNAYLSISFINNQMNWHNKTLLCFGDDDNLVFLKTSCINCPPAGQMAGWLPGCIDGRQVNERMGDWWIDGNISSKFK